MGGCCSKKEIIQGIKAERQEAEYCNEELESDIRQGDHGSRVRLRGPSQFTSMFSKAGRKGVNQDSMTIWEGFGSEEDKIFCGVFDGHGPSGHKVALHVRDVLPSKLCSVLLDGSHYKDVETSTDKDGEVKDAETKYSVSSIGTNDTSHPTISSWKAGFLKAFRDTDKELGMDSTIDSFYSGSTAVTILKQGEHLMIANLGDSRAVLCSTDNRNQPFPVQLTLDLKPNVPSEAERIKKCKGRVLAMDKEPNVFRVWMPEENCPGLAMARAFGDFCLKDYGLISIPQVSYRKLTSRDEFVVLATDGVWDVLSNKEVVSIVASAKKQSIAAQLLVDHAIQAWRTKHPKSRIDDCAVVCLFLKPPSSPPGSSSDANNVGGHRRGFTISRSAKKTKSYDVSESGNASTASANASAIDGLNGNAIKLPRPDSVTITEREGSIQEESKKAI
ncbi:hypothetical protein NE237_010273 [Protea cynaroides]|uniref:PPM-type phosphatase domain-containing protein n=1 Tax=Protea cynaroides TaxID=273540 RepID=A0A9Q0KZ06_9MAGN|nr:hypothetical protein NE237_010273 [Protea cynaroides]